jgi:hypothetical protein
MRLAYGFVLASLLVSCQQPLYPEAPVVPHPSSSTPPGSTPVSNANTPHGGTVAPSRDRFVEFYSGTSQSNSIFFAFFPLDPNRQAISTVASLSGSVTLTSSPGSPQTLTLKPEFQTGQDPYLYVFPKPQSGQSYQVHVTFTADGSSYAADFTYPTN